MDDVITDDHWRSIADFGRWLEGQGARWRIRAPILVMNFDRKERLVFGLYCDDEFVGIFDDLANAVQATADNSLQKAFWDSWLSRL